MSRSSFPRLGIKSLLRSKSQTNLSHHRLSSSSSNASKTRNYVIGALLGSSAIIGGGSLLYAKYDPEFRKTMYKQVPYAEELLSDIIGPVDDKPSPSQPKSSLVEESLMKKKIERARRTSPLARGSPDLNTASPPPPPPIDLPTSVNRLSVSETKQPNIRLDSKIQKGEPANSKTVISQKVEDEEKKSSVSSPFSKLPGSPVLDHSQRLSNLEKEFEKKVEQVREEYEKELTKQLKRQLAANLDHLKDQLEIQRMEIERKQSLLEEERILALKEQYYVDLGAALVRLYDIERILKARESLDKEEIKARKVWMLSQHLLDTLKRSGVSGPQSVKMEVKAVKESIKEMDQGKSFAYIVLDSIPKTALDEGVYNEDTLLERFPKVDKIARRVALISDNGGTLGQYLLSYLQSILVFDYQTISEKELSGEIAVDPSKWDAYDILSRVKVSLSRRDLEQALKYANQLKGASRKVAKDWIKDLRSHLEVRQAANLIQAQAAGVNIRAVK